MNIDSSTNRFLEINNDRLTNLFVRNGWALGRPLPSEYECIDLRGNIFQRDGEKNKEIIVDLNFRPRVKWGMARNFLHVPARQYYVDKLDDMVEQMNVNELLESYRGQYVFNKDIMYSRDQYAVARFFQDNETDLTNNIIDLERSYRQMQEVFIERLPMFTDIQKSDMKKLWQDFAREWDRSAVVDRVVTNLDEERRRKEILRRNKLVAWMRWRIDTGYEEEINKDDVDDLLNRLMNNQEIIRNDRRRVEWYRRSANLMIDVNNLYSRYNQENSNGFFDRELGLMTGMVDEFISRKRNNRRIDLDYYRRRDHYLKIGLGGLAGIDRRRLSEIIGRDIGSMNECEVMEALRSGILMTGERIGLVYRADHKPEGRGMAGRSLLEMQADLLDLRSRLDRKMQFKNVMNNLDSLLGSGGQYRGEIDRIWGSSEEVAGLGLRELTEKMRDEMHQVYFNNMKNHVLLSRHEFLNDIFVSRSHYENWKNLVATVRYEQRRLRHQLMGVFRQMALRMAPLMVGENISREKRSFVNTIVNEYGHYKNAIKILTISRRNDII